MILEHKLGYIYILNIYAALSFIYATHLKQCKLHFTTSFLKATSTDMCVYVLIAILYCLLYYVEYMHNQRTSNNNNAHATTTTTTTTTRERT